MLFVIIVTNLINHNTQEHMNKFDLSLYKFFDYLYYKLNNYMIYCKFSMYNSMLFKFKLIIKNLINTLTVLIILSIFKIPVLQIHAWFKLIYVLVLGHVKQPLELQVKQEYKH